MGARHILALLLIFAAVICVEGLFYLFPLPLVALSTIVRISLLALAIHTTFYFLKITKTYYAVVVGILTGLLFLIAHTYVLYKMLPSDIVLEDPFAYVKFMETTITYKPISSTNSY